MEPHKRSWWLIMAIFVLIGLAVLALLYLMDKSNDDIVQKTIIPTSIAH